MNTHDKDITFEFNGQTVVCEAKNTLVFENKVKGQDRYYIKQQLRALEYKGRIESLTTEECFLKQSCINQLK